MSRERKCLLFCLLSPSLSCFAWANKIATEINKTMQLYLKGILSGNTNRRKYKLKEDNKCVNMRIRSIYLKVVDYF